MDEEFLGEGERRKAHVDSLRQRPRLAAPLPFCSRPLLLPI